MARRLEALGCPPGRIREQRIALDLAGPAPAPPPRPARGGALVIHAAGRFIEKKGLELAIRAFAAVARDHPRAELRIAGSGPLAPRLQRVRRETGLEERIRFLGHLPHAAWREELRRSHVVLCASRTAPDGDGEGGVPTVLLEAQAAARPVVATRHDDIPHVTAPELHRFLSPEGDARALGEALGRLLDAPSEWEALRRAGRRHVEARHDAAHEVHALEELYAELGTGR